MVTKQKAREVFLRWIESVSSRDTTAIDQMAEEIYAADYVWHFPGLTHLLPGPEGVKQSVRGILEGNPNFQITVEDLFVEGDKVAVRCTCHRMDPGTGKPQRLMDILIVRYAGGKDAEEWELIGPWEDEG